MAPKSQPAAASSTDSPSLPPLTTATSSKDVSQTPNPDLHSRNSSPSSTNGLPAHQADVDTMAPGKGAATSQPMAKSLSSSSLSNPPEGKDGVGTGPSPYGTRSRNRNGRARPNYAEDKDLETMDFEMYPERKDDGDPKKVQRQPNSSSGSNDAAPRPTASSTRKPLPTTENVKSAPSAKEPQQQPQQPQQQNHNNDHDATAAAAPPSSSTAQSATTTQPASKKRKAGTHSNSANANQHQGGSAAHKSASSNSTMRKTVGRATGYGETNMMSFDDTKARPKNNTLTADDGTVLAVNDHVYLVCEPPGEPYYIGRIMEFLHKNNNSSNPVDSIRVNWFYRPKDIARKTQDTRQLYATMHSDISPLNTLRGKCTVKHKADIPKLDDYRKIPDCFWWDKLYDRYISKNYDAIPTSQIINVPERVKKVLDERWKFVLVEQGRGKELTSAVKSCKRCNGYCANADSVDCGFCGNTYHMTCVRPPLQKKPARGFGWACAPCNLAQERKLEALNAPHLHASHLGAEDEEVPEEEEEDPGHADTNGTSYGDEEEHPPPTAEQLHQASLWPYRYLGMHCKIEDALDYDDRIYPRASSRLGPRHQATVGPWPGRPVKFVKPLEIKKSGRKDGRHSKETQALIEKDKRERESRPKHIQDEPFPGFIPRGLDLPDDDPNSTSQCLWKPIEDKHGEILKDADGDIVISEAGIDDYMDRARTMWKALDVPEKSTNMEDIARDLLYKNNYDAEKALRVLPTIDKSAFKEPELTPTEQKKFEEAVTKFGSEMQLVKRFVKTVPHGMIVRHWYKWKKTAKGKQIWGNYSARKGKKEIKRAQAEASKAADEVADDHDDSAFDTDKAKVKKKGFMCKFCNTKTSRQWRRAPNVTAAVVTENGSKAKDKGNQYVVALCRRCAELWRRYAIQWEDVEEVAKKVAAAGGRAWKKKVDEELLKELQANNEMIAATNYNTPEPATSSPSPVGGSAQTTTQEPPRKKLKSDRDSEAALASEAAGATAGNATSKKEKKEKDKDKEREKVQEKEKEKPAEKPAPPPPPPMPKARTMPCDICRQLEPLADQHLQCRECRLSVHRNCYGVVDNRHSGKWSCDTCANDKNPQASLFIKCVLCPVENTEHDFVEPPKISHKKKTEKEREREKLEKEKAVKAAEFYRKRQVDLGRPINPREPLKKTADTNWVHVTCAVFTPEVKFGNAKALEPSEGIPSIPRARYQEVCKVCKSQRGACVSCAHCRAPVHVECAHQAGYTLGFDITPVKGSRRDQHNIVTIGGESGTMTAAIWCKEHPPKTTVHRMQDVVDESGLNALQLYVRNFKQADLTLTGCARKANLIPAMTRASTAAVVVSPVNRRASTTTMEKAVAAPAAPPAQVNGTVKEDLPVILQPAGKVCITCGTDVSLKWYPIDESQERLLVNGYHGTLGTEAQLFVAQRDHQCHKCKKANRQPRPVARKETPPPPLPPKEVSQSSAQAVQAVQAASSPQNLMSVGRIAPQNWDNPPPRRSSEVTSSQPLAIAPPTLGPPPPPPPPPGPPSGPPAAPIAPPPISAPMVQPPSAPVPPAAAPPPAPLSQPIATPSIPSGISRGPPPLPPFTTAAPPPPPPPSATPQQQPPPQAPPYNDWRRPSSQHGPPTTAPHPPPPPPPHHMNGVHPHLPPSSMPSLAAPNHLRPPPLSNMPPSIQPSLPNGIGHVHGHGHHGSPPMVNGMPPSPRSHGGGPPPPPLSNGGSSYMHPTYHHQPHHSPHSTSNPPPVPPHPPHSSAHPPRPPEHLFAQVLNPHRSPFSTPHASPPMPRENATSSRDLGPLPPRPPENRQPSGASASPSLRNLLH